MSDAVVTGLNTQKSGADPALKADEELPSWLFELASPPKTLNELRRSKEELGPEEVWPAALSDTQRHQCHPHLSRSSSRSCAPGGTVTSAARRPQEARLVKLENREKIRGTNFTRSK